MSVNRNSAFPNSNSCSCFAQSVSRLSSSLSFSSTLSFAAFSNECLSLRLDQKSLRQPVVCEAALTKKVDSAAKSARQAEKRRIMNKSCKSEVRTLMRKACKHPFVTGEAFTCTYKPPPETRRMNYLLCDEDIEGRKSSKAIELGTAFLTEDGLFDTIRASNRSKVVSLGKSQRSIDEDIKPIPSISF